MAKYYYKDSAGTQHCTTTETGRLNYENGAAIREMILDSGDYTAQLRDKDDSTTYWGKTLPITALGRSRI